MLVTIALGIVLGFIILAALPIIGAALAWLFVIVAGIIGIYMFYDLISTMGIYTFIPLSVIIVYLGLGFLYSITLESAKSFSSFRLFIKFLFLKVFIAGFNDKQKFIKAQKIGELIKYSDNEKKTNKQEKLDKYFQDFLKSFDKLVNLVNIELKEYLKLDYIHLTVNIPTKKSKSDDIKGSILINSKKKKSIVKISYQSRNWYKDEKSIPEYEVIKDSKYIPPFEPSHRDVELWRYSNNKNYRRPKPAIKKTKRYLLKYFQLNSDELSR
jgi:hypothetical protein